MATKVRGITIELGADVTGLEKSLKNANSAISQTQKELRDVNKLLKLDPGNSELLAQKQALLGEAVKNTSDKLKSLKEAAKQAENELNNGSISQNQYNALQREILSTEKELERLTDEQRKFNVEAEKIKAVGSKFEELGNKMRAVSAAAATAVGAIAGLAIKAGIAADDLNTMAKQTGLSTESLQKMAYASDLIDVDIETITSSISKMKRSLDSQEDTFASIGVKIRDQKGDYRDIEDIFYDTVRALGNIGNETERDTLAMKLFGRSADQLAGILDDGGAALREMGDLAESKGQIISQEDLDKANALNDTIDKLKASIKADFMKAGVAIGEALLPTFEKIAAAVSKVTSAFAKLSPTTIKIVTALLALVAVISPLLLLAGSMARSISAIVEVIPLLTTGINVVRTAITALNSSILTLLANPVVLEVLAIIAVIVALGVAIYEVVKHWDDISAAATSAIDKIKTAWSNSKIGQAISDDIESAKHIVSSGMQAMQTQWESGGHSIRNAAASAFEGVKTSISVFMSEAFGYTQGTLSDMIQKFKAACSKIYNSVFDTFASIRNTMVNTVKDAIDGVINELKELPNKAKQALDSLLDRIAEPFENIINSAKKWGSDMVDNFAGGILKNNKARNAASNMAGDVQSYLGFSEPEKGPLSDFHTYAPDMIDLWCKGIRENMYKINEASINMAKTMNPATRTESTNNMTSSIDSLTSAVRSSLATSQSNAPTNVTVVLQGDANNLFRVVSQENSKQVRATGYHALA